VESYCSKRYWTLVICMVANLIDVELTNMPNVNNDADSGSNDSSMTFS